MDQVNQAINHVSISGKLSKKYAKFSVTKNGKSRATFSVQVTDPFTRGQYFQAFEAWGEQAEQIRTSYDGDVLFVRGYLSFDSWTDKDTGRKKTLTRVVASEIETHQANRPTHDQRSNNGWQKDSYEDDAP